MRAGGAVSASLKDNVLSEDPYQYMYWYKKRRLEGELTPLRNWTQVWHVA